MSSLTRRKLLSNGLGLFSLAALAGVGGRYLLTDIEDVVEKIVKHYLGGAGLEPGAAKAFARDYAPIAAQSSKILKVKGLMALELYFLPTFRSALSLTKAQQVMRYDRQVISDFLLSSSYDGLDNRGSALSYKGLNLQRTCNPFARFRN